MQDAQLARGRIVFVDVVVVIVVVKKHLTNIPVASWKYKGKNEPTDKEARWLAWVAGEKERQWGKKRSQRGWEGGGKKVERVGEGAHGESRERDRETRREVGQGRWQRIETTSVVTTHNASLLKLGGFGGSSWCSWQ